METFYMLLKYIIYGIALLINSFLNTCAIFVFYFLFFLVQIKVTVNTYLVSSSNEGFEIHQKEINVSAKMK
jgi:hypothetical protein